MKARINKNLLNFIKGVKATDSKEDILRALKAIEGRTYKWNDGVNMATIARIKRHPDFASNSAFDAKVAILVEKLGRKSSGGKASGNYLEFEYAE